jgi:hypothetical protein
MGVWIVQHSTRLKICLLLAWIAQGLALAAFAYLFFVPKGYIPNHSTRFSLDDEEDEVIDHLQGLGFDSQNGYPLPPKRKKNAPLTNLELLYE